MSCYVVQQKMIENIKHRGLKRLYEHGDRSGLRTDIAEKAELYLSVLDTVQTVRELDITGSSSGLKQERPSMWIWWTIIKGDVTCR